MSKLAKILQEMNKRKPEPWNDLENNFKPEFICEECSAPATILMQDDSGLLACNDCAEASARRARFLSEEAEFLGVVDQEETEEN